MKKIFQKENKNVNSNCHTRLDRISRGMIFNNKKEYYTTGSSGRADACPRMTLCSETGRSMVEMLGVLAVIGVLSVAGIAGYTTAMNQHRANEAINSAMRAAVMLSAQRLANPNATLNTSDLGDGITVGSDTDKLVLTLSNVDEKVRSKIKAMGLKNATIGSDENGALTFTFNNDLSERSGSSGSTSGGNTQQEPETQKSCIEDPSICLHGGCSPIGICNCWGTGYDGDRCQNEVIINKDNFTGDNSTCPCGIYRKSYCKNVAGGCQSWECTEASEDVCQWEADPIQPGACENKGYCNWIEE